MSRDTVLQELVDKDAIRTVLYNYCRGIDRGDRELLATVYHPDATDDHGAYSGSATGFIEWAMTTAPTRCETMQHSLGTIIIELDGDIAYSEAYFVQLNKRWPTDDEPALVDLLVGRYIDELERRDGEWRIAKRVVVKDFRDLHPLNDVADAYTMSIQGRDDVAYRRRDG